MLYTQYKYTDGAPCMNFYMRSALSTEHSKYLKIKHRHKVQIFSHFTGWINSGQRYPEKESSWEMGKNQDSKISTYMR